MKDKIIHFSINRAKQVYWLIALVTFSLTAFIPLIQIDTDPENMLPNDQPDRVFHNSVKEEFRLHDMIVVGVVNENSIYNPESLKAIDQLTQYILTIEGVIQPDLMSLSVVDNITQVDRGTIRFDWLMKNPPESKEKALQIKSDVKRLPLLLDTLVSNDDKAASIYVPIQDKDESYRISQEINSYLQTINSQDAFHITGLPVAEDTFGFEMFVQMGISAPMAAAMIFILMFLFFRNLTFVIAPMIVAMATVLATMGLLIAFGFTVHIMSSMIAIFLMPIAVVDSVHIMSEFADRYKPGLEVKKVIEEVVGHLFRPMLFTSITSTVGFLSLSLTPIPPVQIFGAFVGFGILLAFIWTILFMPAYISRMSEKQLLALQTQIHKHESADTRLSRTLKRLGRFSVGFSKSIVLLFIGVVIVSWYGIQKIEINDNPVRWFKEEHRIRVADKVLNEHFAGTYNAFLVLSMKDPESQKSQLTQILKEQITNLSESKEKDELVEKLSSDVSIQELVIDIDNALFEANAADQKIYENLLLLIEKYQSNINYFTQPETLEYVESLQEHLMQTGLIGKVNSLTDLIKTVNRQLYSGQAIDFRLPDSQNGIAQALIQFQSSHRPQDLWHLVTPDYQKTVLWLQLTSGDNQAMNQVMTEVDQFIEQKPLPEQMEFRWAGKTYINVVWQEAMVSGMLDSLIGAFIVVLVMMIILFRSISFGVLAMLPLSITITFIYGVIGWIGKDYDMPIAVLSALTLGLSVDFAIHFIERARALFDQTGDFKQMIGLMFDEPGRAISRNAIVIAVGFTPLLLAPLVPYITVGVFLATIMAASALVTLLMLPAAMNLLKAFIFKP
ncbi:efflux RND transporter permease subunit [Pleionea sediminis]|uniref:efflux RND transporter permease subunit n=1 Tax=Pleionea sediminis TaxID=2569479 RepID=UPI001185FD1F|nr:MMPL family transporter [Pleionea sediminis]